MSLIKQAINSNIKAESRKSSYAGTGTIMSYDKARGTCSVKYHNPTGEGWYYKDIVPFMENGGGYASDGIRTGSTCSLTFSNGDIGMPIVTGILETRYAERTNDDAGAYILDSAVLNTKIPSKIDPLKDDWFDYDNEDIIKYSTIDFGEDVNLDVNQTVTETFNETNNYTDEESGITNLNSKATIKLEKNGDINIFSPSNVGVKISPDGSIRFYGKSISLNDIEIGVTASSTYITKEDIENEKTNTSVSLEDDALSKKKFDAVINKLKDTSEELKKCIDIVSEIIGDTNWCVNIQQKIDDYKKTLERYNAGGLSSQEKAIIYNALISYQDEFEEELDQARRVGLQ